MAFDTFLAVLKEHDLIPPSALAIMVTGSTARGWDHANSDIDLFVVSTDPMVDERVLSAPVPLEPKTLGVHAFEHGGRRWEIKYWLDSQVSQLFDKVSRDQFDAERMTGIRLTVTEEFFLGRLGTSVALDDGEWHRRRCAELDDSAFRSFMTMAALNRADSGVNAALGQLAAGEHDAAALTVRDAFAGSVEALLNSVGEYSVGVKWRCRRFREARQDLLSYERYWAIETMRDYTPGTTRAWVEEVAGLCKELSMDIEI